jgi:hypothetical protein
MDLKVHTKATMFGALFLIDFMAFEQQQSTADSGASCALDCLSALF